MFYYVGLTVVCLCAIQTACLQLINAIVSTPDDLDFRLHLRNEFLRTGLADILTVVVFCSFLSSYCGHRLCSCAGTPASCGDFIVSGVTSLCSDNSSLSYKLKSA